MRTPIPTRVLSALVLTGLLSRCGSSDPPTLFTALEPAETGITFRNDLRYSMEINPFSFHNFYNGGGVAVGDINNDGLMDLFFCGNQVPNRLYLNKGGMRFEDISARAQVWSDGMWYAGATFADVNGDGFTDLYLSRAADFLVGWRGNQLFINNGNLTFTDRAPEYSLADTGFSTHAVFFDYDNDRDLDCYLLSNSNRSATQYNPIQDQRKVYTQNGGNKLFRNDGERFTDVTREAGIYSSVIGFGLGVSVSDLNDDGWQDIYVSNDFFERDYLYLNNRDGTFTESLEDHVREISLFSMGADIADINNDARPDIYVTDMLPEDEGRLKAKTSFETWEKYRSNVKKGYHHQFLRNVLQLNRGPEPGERDPLFSEISRFAGIHATDWSWGALAADFDNDGWKDIFVSNGMYKDVTDQDFIQFVANDSAAANRNNYKRLIDMLPSQPIANYAFRNNRNLTFTNAAAAWGLATPGFSNGSVYADLDNDGDLDLVTNNINATASVYRNNSNVLHPDASYVTIQARGSGRNTGGFGVRVTAYTAQGIRYAECAPARGFQSSVDPRIHLGLGTVTRIDSLEVRWPGKRQVLYNVGAGQLITINEADAAPHTPAVPEDRSLLAMARGSQRPIGFLHREDELVDFNHDRLLYQMLSTSGPHLAVGDVNGDGTEDLFIAGARGHAGTLFLQDKLGRFRATAQPALESDRHYEDTDCLLADVDGDHDLDLVVSSGGNLPAPSDLAPRLYLNDGNGGLSKTGGAFAIDVPVVNASSLASADYDGDGDIDLFLAQRSVPGNYGAPCSSVLLTNDGKGRFTDITRGNAPALLDIGMATDAAWGDLNGDARPDLVVVGEYMAVKVFYNDGRKLNAARDSAFHKTEGWWNAVEIADVDHDGAPDILAGNHGLNSRFKATQEKPVSLYVGDFDNNGQPEQIICTYNGEKQYPMVLRHDLVAVLPSLKKQFLRYSQYKEKTLDEILPAAALKRALRLDAFEFKTTLFLNGRSAGFRATPLPAEAQFAPVYSFLVSDIDDDGKNEIILGGNFYDSRPEAGIYDGSYGLVLKADSRGTWAGLALNESGFVVKGAIRDIRNVRDPRGNGAIFVAMNRDSLQVFRHNRRRIIP